MNHVHSYTREQAIEDGVLVDFSVLAKEAGFSIPVAFTQGLMSDIGTDDIYGKAWDILFLAAIAARKSKGSMTTFKVTVGKKIVDIWAIISGEGPGGAPVVTIMRPEDY